MPIVEGNLPKPDYAERYASMCLINSLESMLGQLLGQPVLAPEEVYVLRNQQVRDSHRRDVEAEKLNNDLMIWARLSKTEVREELQRFFYYQLVRDLKLILETILPAWSATDPDLAALITRIRPEFINLPLADLIQLSLSGKPIGAIVLYKAALYHEHKTAHIFHLAPGINPGITYAASDEGKQRQKLNKWLANGKMAIIIEETRAAIGFSGLILHS